MTSKGLISQIRLRRRHGQYACCQQGKTYGECHGATVLVIVLATIVTIGTVKSKATTSAAATAAAAAAIPSIGSTAIAGIVSFIFVSNKLAILIVASAHLQGEMVMVEYIII